MLSTPPSPVITLTEQAVVAAHLYFHPANIKQPIPPAVETAIKTSEAAPQLLHMALNRLRLGASQEVQLIVDQALGALAQHRPTQLTEINQWLPTFVRRFPALFRPEEESNPYFTIRDHARPTGGIQILRNMIADSSVATSIKPNLKEQAHKSRSAKDFLRFLVPSNSPWKSFITSLYEQGVGEKELVLIARFVQSNKSKRRPPTSAGLQGNHKTYSFIRNFLPAVAGDQPKSIAHLALSAALYDIVPQSLARFHSTSTESVIFMTSSLPNSGIATSWLFVDGIRHMDEALKILENEPQPFSVGEQKAIIQVFGKPSDEMTVRQKFETQRSKWLGLKSPKIAHSIKIISR